MELFHKFQIQIIGLQNAISKIGHISMLRWTLEWVMNPEL